MINTSSGEFLLYLYLFLLDLEWFMFGTPSVRLSVQRLDTAIKVVVSPSSHSGT
jgi:hypothetical protein